MILTSSEMKSLSETAGRACEAIMKIYNTPGGEVYSKKDNSCVTAADWASHDILCRGIRELFRDIPILSEEGRDVPYRERKKWGRFWLIDPLDGTKEFISKNGEFTVNIALIENGSPVFGYIAIPAKEVVYCGQKGAGALRKEKNESPVEIKARNNPAARPVIARSRSHGSAREDEIISGLGPAETVCAGSSLKFCLVAEGAADIYLRTGPTMEWDTAAGQCVAESAGALVRTFEGEPLQYNKKSLLNPGFICAGGKYPLDRLARGRRRDGCR